MARLRIFKDGKLSQVFNLAGGGVTIGSGSGSELVVMGERIAGRHVRLGESAGGWTLEVCEGVPPISVNGKLAANATLASGARFEFGGYRFELEGLPEPQSRPPTPARAAPPKAAPGPLAPLPDLLGLGASSLDPARTLKELFRATRKMGSRADSEELLANMMDCLIDVFGAERGFILLADARTHQLEPAIARSIDAGDLRSAISTTVTGRVFRQGKPLALIDAHAESRTQQAATIQREQLRSIICAPLVQEDGTVLGVVYLDSRVRSRLYTDKDLDLLDAFTHYSVIAIEGARERDRLRRDVDSLRKLNLERVLEEHNFENVIHRSPAMTRVLEQVKAVAARDVTAVILGESGTGKELIARAIHHRSARAKGPFVAINCMALSRDLIESELFGHEKGAFSGAVARRQGRFELANGGTFLLDEVGELPPPVQGKLLRVLQEGEFERVGGTQAIRVDVRILGATHKDLRREVAEGRFREDLFYRINVFALDIPPLRQRPEDIPLLVSHFIEFFNQKMGRTIRGIEAAALERLVRYPWPGNVRELRNVVERAFVLEPSDTLTQSSLPIDIAAGSGAPAQRRPGQAAVAPAASLALAGAEPDPGPEAEELPSEETSRLDHAATSVDGGPAVLAIDSLPRDYESAREEFERVFLRAAIRRNQGNISEAARETGISRRHIYRMMKSLGL